MPSNDFNDNAKKSARGGFIARHGKKITAGALCFVLAVVMFSAGWLTSYFSQDERTRSLEFLLNNYDNYYLETREDAESDVAKALSDALLDKYSEYYTAEEYAAEKKASYGEKKGLGITFLSNDFSIYSVSGNSPAEHAGILSGGKVIGYKTAADEVLVEVNADNAKDELEAFISKLSDSDGEITLKIKYGESVESYALKKSEYNEGYVYYADASGYYGFSGDSELALTLMPNKSALSELGEKTAYIKLTQFNGLSKSGCLGASEQVKVALDKFKNDKKSELIFDLRANGGGFMSILCNIASYLCDYDGDSALCQKAIDKNGKEQLFDNKLKSQYKNYGFEKIVILADENSASASEALIGAMLDYDKASGNNAVSVILSPSELNDKVVYKTYGKGIMQTTYENLLTHEAVKLTTAKIYWPVSGVCIHGVGVTDELCSEGYNVISGTSGDVSAAIEYLKGE